MAVLRSMSVVVLWALLLLLQVCSLRIEAYLVPSSRLTTTRSSSTSRGGVWMTSSPSRRWSHHHDRSSTSPWSYQRALHGGRRWREKTGRRSLLPLQQQQQEGVVVGEGQGAPQVIQLVPNNLLTKSELVDMIITWAEEQVRTGSAIKLQKSSEGIKFTFTSSLESYLSFVIHNNAESGVFEVRTSSYLSPADNSQVQSLLNFLMSHLLESITIELQVQLIDREPVVTNIISTETVKIQPIPQKPSEEKIPDHDPKAYLYEKSFVESSPTTSHSAAETDLLMSEEEISKLWVQKPLTVEEQEFMQKVGNGDFEEEEEDDDEDEDDEDNNSKSGKGQVYNIQSDYYHKRLHTWEGLVPSSPLRHYLIEQIQHLIEGLYQSRSVGISTKRTKRGITLDFDIVDNFQMVIEVEEDEEDRVFFTNMFFQDSSSKSLLTWKQIDESLQTAVQNMEVKISYELRKLSIPSFTTSTATSTITESQSLQSSSSNSFIKSSSTSSTSKDNTMIEEDNTERSALEQILSMDTQKVSKSVFNTQISSNIEDSLLNGNPNDYLQQAEDIRQTDANQQVPFEPFLPFQAQSSSSSKANTKVKVAEKETKSLQEQAVEELNTILARSRGNGFYSIIQEVRSQEQSIEDLALSSSSTESSKMATVDSTPNNKANKAKKENKQKAEAKPEEASIKNLQDLFKIGAAQSKKQHQGDWIDSMTPYQLLQSINEYAARNNLAIDIKGANSGISSFVRKDKIRDSDQLPFTPNSEESKSLFRQIQTFFGNDTKSSLNGMTGKKSAEYKLQSHRIDMLVSELERCYKLQLGGDIERNLLDSFRDVLLSTDFLLIMKERNQQETNDIKRQCYAKMIETSLHLNYELLSLMQQESIKHYKLIEEICNIATQYQDQELAFLNEMDKLKPQFTINFYKFMNYAVDAEEKRVIKEYLLKFQPERFKKASSSKGFKPSMPSLSDRELLNLPIEVTEEEKETILKSYLSRPNWLGVLLVVRQGLENELLQRYDHQLECLWIVVRTPDAFLRTKLFSRFVELTPATELPYLRELALNMVSSVEQQVAQYEYDFGYDFDSMPKDLKAMFEFDPHLSARLTRFRSEVNEILSEDLIQTRMELHALEAEEQGKELMFRYRNPQAQEEIETQEKIIKDTALHGHDESSINSMLFPERMKNINSGEEEQKPPDNRLLDMLSQGESDNEKALRTSNFLE